MNGMIDLHHHLLHGMDDGPQTFEESVRMLRCAARQGIVCVAATSHVYPNRAFDRQKYQRHLQKLREYAHVNRLPVQVVSGMEVFWSGMTPWLLQKGALRPLGDSWHVLVEFPTHVQYETICRSAVQLANAGYSMVLAHAERYRCLRWGRRLERLRGEYHIRVQINSSTLLQGRKGLRGRWIEKIMDAGWVDLVASDAHNLHQRSCTLDQCARLIEDKWGRETAERLLIGNPAEILLERNEQKKRRMEER